MNKLSGTKATDKQIDKIFWLMARDLPDVIDEFIVRKSLEKI
jgi:hypothetical protein